MAEREQKKRKTSESDKSSEESSGFASSRNEEI